MDPRPLLLPALFAALAALPAPAQRDSAQRDSAQREAERPERGGTPESAEVLEAPTEPGIAWFGSWDAGLAEARRTGRPILIMSATPQCHGVPGMW